MRKPILEDVKVDGRVIEQLPETIFSPSKEVELRFSTRFESLSMFVRLKTP
jgi:hypothetical protein